MATPATAPHIPPSEDRWLSSRQASEYLGFKGPEVLKAYRERGTGPKFSRLTPKTCRYRLSDLIEFCLEHQEQSNG
jgi:predicted DNA-binding transcriptional regulator AlpA